MIFLSACTKILFFKCLRKRKDVKPAYHSVLPCNRHTSHCNRNRRQKDNETWKMKKVHIASKLQVQVDNLMSKEERETKKEELTEKKNGKKNTPI